jgi:hypothetical protein
MKKRTMTAASAQRPKPRPWARAASLRASAEGGAVVDAIAPKMDVIAAGAASDAEPRDAGADADAGLTEVEPERTGSKALA